MADDPEISDVLLRTFLARRDLLRDSQAARGIEIVGSGLSAAALALRTYAARQRLPHLWLDADSMAGQALMRLTPLAAADLPAVVTPQRVLRRATPGQLAEVLGLSYHSAAAKVADLAIVGSGPAGLAAAVYSASEGLDTLLLDAIGTGGQAASSSRIENYPGFPSGLSGHDLTQRAALQALKFGATLSSPSQVTALDTTAQYLQVRLADGTAISSRAILIATGSRYRVLPLARWAEFEGAGIYYAATELEARACGTEPVTVIGGANSAGQAALFLAARGNPVTLAIRGPDPAAGMSAYLLDRLRAHPGVAIRPGAEVTSLAGETELEAITVTDTASPEGAERPCRGLFCFIGAEPATDWIQGMSLDSEGYIRTDVQLAPETLGPIWRALDRAPFPFETSVPAVFAAGDVRRGSMKRVAAAVGEGASAVRSVHAAIGMRF
jgi:thioredoxin reductase (NADPH)